MSAVSATRASMFAVPSRYKFLHSCPDEPKSKVSSVLGIIELFTSAPNTTLSPASAPRVRVPPLNVVVPVTVALPPTVKLPPTSKLPVIPLLLCHLLWIIQQSYCSKCLLF
jgi:hypothetical protein